MNIRELKPRVKHVIGPLEQFFIVPKKITIVKWSKIIMQKSTAILPSSMVLFYGIFQDLVLNKSGGGPGVLIFLRFLVTIFCTKTYRNAMKHMILSFKMKVDVICDHFLMLWFQKDSLDTVGFRSYARGCRVETKK